MNQTGTTASAATPGKSDATAGEHRRSPRKRTLKEARVVLTDRTTMDCLVRDMSAQGARLAFGAPVTLPTTFSLLMVASEKLIPAELLWQRGLLAGIAFTGPERQARARPAQG
jgi:hypothetical protein